MRSLLDTLNRHLDIRLGLTPRLLLLSAAGLLAVALLLPLWNLTMFAPQYPDGLRMDIYSYELKGGRGGQDVREINLLNHYIGMVWFALALVFDIGVLGAATLLRSGDASRLLIVSALLNPIDAVRTGAFIGVEGTGAFGPASQALLRFTHGAAGAATLIGASLVSWIVLPALFASRRLARIDIC